MGTISFSAVEADCDERDYDGWSATLAQASARLDSLQAAVTELQRLCQSQDVHSEQVLKVLAEHGAIAKSAARSVAA